MKIAEFNALCDREWAKPKRGDVVALTLTEASAEELTLDALLHPQHFGHILPFNADDLEDIRAGRLPKVVNPVTRTVVTIRTKPDGKQESARVRVMGGTVRRTWWPASAPPPA